MRILAESGQRDCRPDEVFNPHRLRPPVSRRCPQLRQLKHVLELASDWLLFLSQYSQKEDRYEEEIKNLSSKLKEVQQK